MKMYRCACSFVLSLFVVAIATGADWPQFRGPNSSGQSSETGLPLTWGDESNVVWRTAMPGFGASSPITFGDRIYLTCYSGYGLSQKELGEQKNLVRHLVAVNRASGKIVWDNKTAAAIPEQKYRGFVGLHGYASSTPAADKDAVYVFYGRTGAAAYSHTGSLIWKKNLGDKTHNFGSANSPVLYKGLVIFNASVECGNLVALDKKTGREVWRAKGMKRSWNTPLVVSTRSGDELVVDTEGKILAFDPATGRSLWECQAMDAYICPSVIAQNGVVYAIGSRKNTCIAVRAGGRGDVTKTHRLWSINKGSNVSSPVWHDGHLYFASESKGIVYCVNAKDGKIVYQQRLDPRPGIIYASPVAVDGRLYYMSRGRGAFVLPAKPKFELLAHNVFKKDSSVFNGSPVVSRGQLLLRSDKYLYCVGKKKE